MMDYEDALRKSERQDEQLLAETRDACPQCGERRADWLISTSPSQAQVRCCACGRIFEPADRGAGS